MEEARKAKMQEGIYILDHLRRKSEPAHNNDIGSRIETSTIQSLAIIMDSKALDSGEASKRDSIGWLCARRRFAPSQGIIIIAALHRFQI